MNTLDQNISNCAGQRSKFRQYRIYFRGADKDGTVWWGIDEGNTYGEIRVKCFNIREGYVSGCSSYGPQPPRSYNGPWQEELNVPESWISVGGYATFENGGVTISNSENQ